MTGPVLRLFRFRPAGPGSVLDATLRESLAPRLVAIPGLREVHLGRRGPDESGERLVLTIWESEAAMQAGVGPTAAGAHGRDLEAELVPAVVEPALEVYSIRVDLPFAPTPRPGILRVFRGETLPDVLDAYVGDVERGTIADVEAGTGPLALFLGADPPNRFVTVSLWTDWDVIQTATGGNLRQPVATRHANRLRKGSAVHYEVLPEAVAAGSEAAER